MHTKYENFQEFPLKVIIFRRYPTALYANDLPATFQRSYLMRDVWRSNKFSGVDGLMLANAAKTLNFTAITVPSSNIDFGYKNWDGSFVGNFNSNGV